jgi:ABC-type multidrug transport system fused ATPase/permease subunit
MSRAQPTFELLDIERIQNEEEIDDFERKIEGKIEFRNVSYSYPNGN